jgi:6-pyruvoyltetrahydropterin/6-carboxytetrahydropterin synthase
VTSGSPRVELTRVYHFSAGHRLANPALDAEANERLYGPCFRPHGHNYYLEVTVAGVPEAHTGMAVDLDHLDALVTDRLITQVDHRTLEDLSLLEGVVSTGEGLARAFWEILAPPLGAGLVRVAVVETAKNRFEYEGETD